MAKLATIARRTFLIGSAAVVGGVAFGVYKVRQTAPNPLLDDLPQGATALTPYVRIDGQVKIGGENIYGKDVDVIELRKRVGMVFQRSNPFPKSIFESWV